MPTVGSDRQDRSNDSQAGPEGHAVAASAGPNSFRKGVNSSDKDWANFAALRYAETLDAPLRLPNRINNWLYRIQYDSLRSKRVDHIRDRAQLRITYRFTVSLFEPYLSELTSTYGDDIGSKIRHYCFALRAAQYRSNKTAFNRNMWMVSIVLGLYLLSLIALVSTRFSHNTLYDIFKIALLVVVLFLATITVLRYCFIVPAIFLNKLLYYNPTRLFRRALGSSQTIVLTATFRQRQRLERSTIPWLMVSGVFAILAHLSLRGSINSLVASALDGYGMLAMGFGAISLTIQLLFQRSHLLGTYMPPDLLAFRAACCVLWAAPGLNCDIVIRKYLLEQIDTLSQIFAFDLPRSIAPLSSFSDKLTAQFRSIAVKLGELKTWIAFPQSQTAAALATRAAFIGAAIASHQYHYLKADCEAEAAPDLVLSRKLFEMMRNIILGFFPVAIFLVLKAFDVQMSPQVETSWLISGVVWAAVNLLAAQPDFNERLAATKNVISVFPLSSPKG